ncbi:MAG: putative bifunctional diguanylate cyclase/phosphodiesterase [Janthinobacterium lividum]
MTIDDDSDLKMSFRTLSPFSALSPHDGDDRLIAQIQRYEAAIDNMSQGLCMYDDRSRLVLCNARYCEIFNLPSAAGLFGLTQDEICSRLITSGAYSPSITIDMIRASADSALRNRFSPAVWRELADGRVLSVIYRALDGGGWVSTFEDVTELRRKEAQIVHLARHDGLTDLANARTLLEESHALLTSFPPSRPVLAMHYLDLDRFKFVNDTYGHAVGDELLRAVADRLRHAVRRDDVVARLGGDEFALLQRVPDASTARAIADQLAKAIGAPYDLSTGRVEIGVSIGVATHSGVVANLEPLLQDADLALREAKVANRGTVCCFDPAMSVTARMRRNLEAELHRAVEADEFEVHYQPLVDLERDTTVGVEALVRWRHPEKGLVSPATFIPLAEEIGLIVQIGEWVLRQACRDAATWPNDVSLAVNVSGVQLRQKGFVDVVHRALSDSTLEPERLELEITESALLDESEVVMRNLQDLRAMGIRFAMDDFGTGYSSLSYLRRFPIDKIKIDRSFMKDAETSADALAIIRAVAGLGVSLGITTLIEGVETEQQLTLARHEGVGQVQGYYFSTPQPGPVILGMLDGRS